MKRRAAIVASILAAFIAGGAVVYVVRRTPAPVSATSPTETRVITARSFDVVRVVDGDTFKVVYDGIETSVRFITIDTPERGQPGAVEATQALRALIARKTVRLEFADPDGRKRDRYGRLLCKVYVGDLDVGAELLRLGHARKWER